jgi:hypothetical protein
MPQYDITSPQGEKFRVTAPEGASQDQVLNYFQKNYKSAPDTDYLGTAESVARGAASSVLGTVGEIQQGINYPFNAAMRAVGLPQYQAGHWPTTEEFEQVLPGQAAAERHPIAQTVGEFVPAVGSLAAGAAREAPAIARSAGRIVSEVLPGASERAVGSVAKIGSPTDVSVLGEKMKGILEGRFKKLSEARTKEAEKLKSAFVADEKSANPTIREYQDYLTDLYETKVASLSSKEKQILLDSSKELAGDRSVEAIQKEARRLEYIANRGDLQGYGAIEKTFAGDLAKKLTESLESHSAAYKKFRAAYRDMSAPINQFTETGLGKKATAEASDRLPDIPKYDPAVLPTNFFKTKHSVNVLRELTGGDEKTVDSFAAEYAASQLTKSVTGKKIGVAATDARNWYNSNKIWLDEIPTVRDQVKQYVDTLEKTAATQKAAKFTAGGALLLYLAHPVWALRSLIMGL